MKTLTSEVVAVLLAYLIDRDFGFWCLPPEEMLFILEKKFNCKTDEEVLNEALSHIEVNPVPEPEEDFFEGY